MEIESLEETKKKAVSKIELNENDKTYLDDAINEKAELIINKIVAKKAQRDSLKKKLLHRSKSQTLINICFNKKIPFQKI